PQARPRARVRAAVPGGLRHDTRAFDVTRRLKPGLAAEPLSGYGAPRGRFVCVGVVITTPTHTNSSSSEGAVGRPDRATYQPCSPYEDEPSIIDPSAPRAWSSAWWVSPNLSPSPAPL